MAKFTTCLCSARGITVQGHPAQGARWWSRLFHINRVFNFSRESISSNCILDKQIIIFSISLNILPELKLSEHETNMIILTFIHFFFILLLQSRHFELTRVYWKFFLINMCTCVYCKIIKLLNIKMFLQLFFL